MRGLFNATFKTNPYLERAVMTGITRVSKESVFSDLNNLTVITTTSDQYADCFGFTEEEVFKSLDQFGMSDKKQIVKQWYDGFSFGPFKDIYNPWSIKNYLKEKKLRPYWASTSSNGLISKLLQSASANMKTQLEELLNGKHFSQRSQPERFYHGFVLGLLVEVRDLYEIRSNRESGYGRYDVMLIPKTKKNDGIILEFKVKEAEEKTLEETVQTALAQIEDKEYDTKLLELGVSKEHIRHYGFAFEGKKVLIG